MRGGQPGSGQRAEVSHITVAETQAGQRIDNYLMRLLKGVPKSHIYRILRTGQVRVNRHRVKPTYRVQHGDWLRIPPLLRPAGDKTRAPVPASVLRRLEAAVLHEDDELLVLNKPAGMAVHGGSGLPFGVIEALRQSRADGPPLELAHRLDRDTSGCLILAKSQAVLRALAAALRTGQIAKHYLALLAGRWENGTAVIAAPLRKVACGARRAMQVHEAGKVAETVIHRLEQFEDCTLVRLELRTGRMHQIRVHMAHLGHPVVGDDKYGDFTVNKTMRKCGLKRLFLHAARVRFHLASSGQRYDIHAPLDPALEGLVERLRVQ